MSTLGRLLKILILAAIISLLGLTVYAALFDLPPPERELVIPLALPQG